MGNLKEITMILKSEQVVLRPIRLSDAARFVQWSHDPLVRKLGGWRTIRLREERTWIRSLTKKRKKERQFAIETAHGVLVGSCGLVIDDRYHNATLGIVIGNRRYWDKGLGTEAMKLLLSFGFERLRLHRIQLKVYAYNARALRVYRKMGFRTEGRARESVYQAGRYHDGVYMGLLASEWRKKKRAWHATS